MNDQKYMMRAIELAKKAKGAVSPNPLVGAVIVKDGRIIGEGYHVTYGGLHAETAALAAATEDPQGATVYVNLEPCCHAGKQGACSKALIEAGISRLVYGSVDPNPKVAGQGLQELRSAGIQVDGPLLEEECLDLNRTFNHYMTTGLPYVALKYAMSMDGKIATKDSDSRWITSDEANRFVHELRNDYQGILVGIRTVLTDDPLLTCRIEGGVNPTRIILDAHLQIPIDSNIAQTAKVVSTLVFTGSGDTDQRKQLEDLGIEVYQAKSVDGKLDLNDVLRQLGKLKIASILVEGGAQIHGSFFDANLANRLYAFIAPKIIGGQGLSPVGGIGISRIADAKTLKTVRTQNLGPDLLIESEV